VSFTPAPPIVAFLLASVFSVWVCYNDSLRPHQNFRDALKVAGWWLLSFYFTLAASGGSDWILEELKKR
jgi:hypothetical protein